ncbi:MAG: GNAT family N-acetyltransferase [Devosia sp.]
MNEASPLLQLRDYRPGDAAAIAAIYAHYVRTSVCTFDFEPPAAAAMAEKFAAMVKKGHPVVIGEVGGEVAGYAYASDFRPRPGYRFTCEDSIYLDPEMTGKGYGALLLGEVIAKARACGFKQMIAIIAGGIESSVRLHERFGFTTLGVFPNLGHKFDRWIDIVHMQRAL